MSKAILHSRADGGVAITWLDERDRRMTRARITTGSHGPAGETIISLPAPASAIEAASRIHAALPEIALRDIAVEAIEWGESEDEFCARCAAKAAPAGTIKSEIVDRAALEASLPPKDEYRSAWKAEGGRVVIDMTKAGEIFLARLRAARDAALRALDGPYMRALERGDEAEQQRIAGEKQRLRDLPQTLPIGEAEDVAALKRLWPAELPPSPGLTRGPGSG